jgi:hypothetical protein
MGFAQTFTSGSTGADGPFAPATNTTLTLPADGIFNFTTITIPAGVTVTFQKNAANTPVTMLATGDVSIAGTINLNGSNGISASSSGPVVNPGGAGGPGGFSGGNGGPRSSGTTVGAGGLGPGGGLPETTSDSTFNTHGNYGAPVSFVTLLPLFGGSGGGGQSGNEINAGASGGGGGGAIVIASSTKITLLGSITANGGRGDNNCFYNAAGGGSGGAIRLVAPQIDGNGTLQATGGIGPCNTPAGSGRIRLEAFTHGFAGSVNPVASVSVAPGPVTASSNPALSNLPTLTIGSVDGVTSPSNPSGSYTAADVSLPQGTTNPVTVTLTATNTPVGTIFTVKLIPQFAAVTSLNSTASTGTFASSTATVSVTFPSGQVSLLNAFASFTLPTQIASALPLIEGEHVESVLLAAEEGEHALMLVTRSGKEYPAKKILGEERLAALWSGLFQAR